MIVLMFWFSTRLRLSVKINDEYRDYKELPAALMSQQGPVGPSRPKENRKMITAGRELNLFYE
jgi:pleiotropic regulator 1